MKECNNSAAALPFFIPQPASSHEEGCKENGLQANPSTPEQLERTIQFFHR